MTVYFLAMKMRKEYRIPLFLALWGLVWVHFGLCIIFMLELGIVLYFLVVISIFLLPILWIIGIIKKQKKKVLWAKVGLLSIAVSLLAPIGSMVVVNEIDRYRLTKLTIELDRYKHENGHYPESASEATPFYNTVGMQYIPSPDGKFCQVSYGKVLGSVIYSNKSGKWEQEKYRD